MRFILKVAVCLLILSGPGQAQERRLLPAAQKAFDEGLKSVAQQDWKNAVRLFEEAQKLGGHDPRIILNLALASTKAGQTAPAAAWLDAYLASSPEIANADAVRAEILRLKQALLQKADELFASAADKASKLPGNNAVIALKILGDSQINAGLFVKGIQTQQRARDFDNQARLAALGRLEPPEIAVKDDDLYSARARSLAYEQKFTEAMKVADLIGSAKDRDLAIAGIIKASGAQRTDLADPAPPQSVISQIGNEKLRADTERGFRSRIVRDELTKKIYGGLIDEKLLAEYSALEPDQRPGILREIVVHLLRKADLPAAEKWMAEVAKGPFGLELQTKFAVALLQAGKTADANAAAKKAIEFAGTLKEAQALGVDRYIAVNRAILGSPNETLAIVKTPRQVPYAAFIGDPDFVGFYDPRIAEVYSNEFLLGTLTFILSMQGKEDAALKFARGAPADLQIPLTNVAYVQILRNTPQKALEILKTVPLPHHDAAHSKAQALGLIVLAAIKKDDISLAERAVSDMPPSGAWQQNWAHGIRYRVEANILIARAHFGKGNRENARRLLEGTKALIFNAQADAALQKLRSDHLDDLLDRVAAFEEETGNATTAGLTRQNKLPLAPERVQSFHNLARLFSGSPDLLDTQARLQEANANIPNLQPGMIANLALRFVWAVHELERLEEQNGLKVAIAYDDQAAWAQLKSQNRPAYFRAFIVQFPESPLVAEAEKILAALVPSVQSPENSKQAELAAPKYRVIGNNSALVVAFSPDGSSVATASDDAIVLLDLGSGQKIKELRVTDDSGRRFTSLAFSPDSRTLVSANNPSEGIVRIFDVTSGTQTRSTKIGENDGLVYSPLAVVDPTGTLVATTFWANKPYTRGVKIWNIGTGALLRTITTTSSVHALAFSPRGDLLAGGTDQLVALWRTSDGQLVKALAGHTEGVEAVAFSPDGRLLVSGSRDKTAMVWDVAAGRANKTLSGHTDGVRSVAFSPDGRRVASEAFDKSIRVWELESGASLKLTLDNDGYLDSVAFSPDGKHLASGSSRGVVLWPLHEVFAVGPSVRAPVDAALPALTPQPPIALQSNSADTAAWDLIKETTDAALLRRFISQYPDSRYKADAEARLAMLSDTPPVSPVAPSSSSKPERSAPASKPTRTNQRVDAAPSARKPAPTQGCFVFNGRRICE